MLGPAHQVSEAARQFSTRLKAFLSCWYVTTSHKQASETPSRRGKDLPTAGLVDCDIQAGYCSSEFGTFGGRFADLGLPARSVRDRVALQTPLGDAAAVVRAARRVGRVVYRSRRSSPLQKLDQKWRCFHTSSSISARWRNQGRAGASARAQGCWAAGSFARRRLASLLLAPDADGVGRGRLRRLRMACRGADPKTLARSETNQRCPEATLRMAKG
jgi:hypothetical protein